MIIPTLNRDFLSQIQLLNMIQLKYYMNFLMKVKQNLIKINYNLFIIKILINKIKNKKN